MHFLAFLIFLMKALEILSEIIINAGIAQGFLLAIFFAGTRNKVSHWLLSLLLIDLSLIIFRVHYLMYYLFDILGTHFFITGPFLLLLGPFLYFYLRSIVIPGTGIGRKDYGHFIVFAVYMLLVTSIYITGKDSDFSALLRQVVGSPWLFLVLQFAYYLVQTQRLIKVHKKSIVEKFSNVEGMDASWLQYFIWVFVAILVFITVAIPSIIHGIGFSTYKTTSAIFYSLVLFFIAYKGLKQRVPVPAEVIPESNGVTSDSDTLPLQKEKLLKHIAENKPYLNPELTLVELAAQLDMGRNQLSQVINLGVGGNFYNFINKFRVEEVKRLIKEDPNRQFKIMSLASEAGFNSKSSFNHIFKKMTGLTPSEYRDGHI